MNAGSYLFPGAIKAALTPTQISVEEKAVAFIDQIRMRMNDINIQLKTPDGEPKAGRLGGDAYFQQKQKLIEVLNVYREELHCLGVVP